MKALFYTREFPPYVYGGAGVHVEYLAAELAKLMELDVRCFGDQDEKTVIYRSKDSLLTTLILISPMINLRQFLKP